MINTPLTQKALAIATKAHATQTDRAGAPYIQHPTHLAQQMDSEDSTIVALLHDVVEDSDISFEDLEEAGFSEHIITALKLLTHSKEEDYFTYVQKIKANPLATKVKLADLAHNSDVSRLPAITEKDTERVAKYKKAIQILTAE